MLGRLHALLAECPRWQMLWHFCPADLLPIVLTLFAILGYGAGLAGYRSWQRRRLRRRMFRAFFDTLQRRGRL